MMMRISYCYDHLYAHLLDAQKELGCLPLMRLIAHAAHPFHDFLVKNYILEGVHDPGALYSHVVIRARIEGSNEISELRIEYADIPSVVKDISSALTKAYLLDRSKTHLLPYYRIHFQDDMGC